MAMKDLRKLTKGTKEEEPLKQWGQVLRLAKNTEKYKNNNTLCSLSWGVYQIDEELNTFTKDEKTGDNVADYPEPNGSLRTLKTLVRDYYLTEIKDKLFEYEFLK